MIIDTIENLSNYASLNPLFADVVAFLNANDLQTMEPGKYPIKDKDLFLNLQVAKQRTKETAFLETHIEMIDIQIPVSAAETAADVRHHTAGTVRYLLPPGRSHALHH